MDYNQSVNLLKLSNACIVSVKGKTAVKKGIFIPIEENDLHLSFDEKLQPKGVYLNMNTWELREKSQYGDTHLVKQAFSKDYRDAHEDTANNAPILGSMKPIQRKEIGINGIPVEVEDESLPF